MNLEFMEKAGIILLKNSAAGAILVFLILAARSFLHNRISPKWLFGLWLLAILRFLTPWTPASPFSMLNLLRHETFSLIPADEREEALDLTAPPSLQNTPAVVIIQNDNSKTPEPSHKASSFHIEPSAVLAIVWSIGAVGLAIFIVLRSLYFWFILRKEKPVTQQDVLELLEECKSKLKIHTLLCIVQTSRIQTPALMDLFVPGSLSQQA